MLNEGQVVEQGTHDTLLENEAGTYYGLVHSQQLALGDSNEAADSDDQEEDLDAILRREKSAALSEATATAKTATWKERGLIGSFGKLLFEQKSRFPSYGLTILFAMIAGGKLPDN